MAAVSPSRGEVWWHEPPHDKSRPMLVLTRDEAIDVLNLVLAVPITRSARDIPTHVHLDESDGMQGACALALDTTGPIAKGHLTRRITTLGPERMSAVCRALRTATGC
jgi:mRNA interferase MazF